LGVLWIIIGLGAEFIGSIWQIILKKKIDNENDNRLKIKFFMWASYSFLFEIFYFPFLNYNLLVKNGDCLLYSDRNKTKPGIEFNLFFYII
jgi:Na+/proline symporter